MKRIVSLFMAIVMAFSIITVNVPLVFADDDEQPTLTFHGNGASNPVGANSVVRLRTRPDTSLPTDKHDVLISVQRDGPRNQPIYVVVESGGGPSPIFNIENGVEMPDHWGIGRSGTLHGGSSSKFPEIELRPNLQAETNGRLSVYWQVDGTTHHTYLDVVVTNNAYPVQSPSNPISYAYPPDSEAQPLRMSFSVNGLPRPFSPDNGAYFTFQWQESKTAGGPWANVGDVSTGSSGGNGIWGDGLIPSTEGLGTTFYRCVVTSTLRYPSMVANQPDVIFNNVVHTSPAAMIVIRPGPAPVFVPSDLPGANIDLSLESINLPESFTVAKYSVTGGVRWVNKSLPDLTDPRGARAFSNFFNKEMTLWLENSEGDQIKFPTIAARPRANNKNTERVAAFYNPETPDVWNLWTRPEKTNSAGEPALAYQYVMGDTERGALPAEPPWLSLDENAFEILPRFPRGDKTRHVFYFRLAPISITAGEDSVYVPASKHFRVNPAFLGNETKLRIDYRTETIRTTLNHEYSLDSGKTWLPSPRDLQANGKFRAVPLNISEQINSSGSVLVRVAATGRRPRTANQEIVPVARAVLETKSLTVSNGKIDTNEMRLYDIWNANEADPSKSRWGGLPRMTDDGVHNFIIRVKPTAKLVRGEWTGEAASSSGTITATRTGGRLTAALVSDGSAKPDRLVVSGENHNQVVTVSFTNLITIPSADVIGDFKMVVGGPVGDNFLETGNMEIHEDDIGSPTSAFRFVFKDPDAQNTDLPDGTEIWLYYEKSAANPAITTAAGDLEDFAFERKAS
ncbi:MAG: hypothetical protein FWH05_03830 [Oscillospiraceae bacterium]|nr:hypothetical protein [Oscillospiraceae bacterium]